MDERHYELRVLPLFEEKLQEAADYIAFHLHNPIAAVFYKENTIKNVGRIRLLYEFAQIQL